MLQSVRHLEVNGVAAVLPEDTSLQMILNQGQSIQSLDLRVLSWSRGEDSGFDHFDGWRTSWTPNNTQLKLVIDSLACQSALTKLSLRSNELQDSFAHALGLGLKNCLSLTAVDLSRNRIQKDGFLEIVRCCTSVRTLDLSQNWISLTWPGDQRGKLEDLTQALRKCEDLQLLNLEDNDIIDFSVLAACTSLTDLIVTSTESAMTKEAAQNVDTVLSQLPNLSRLKLSHPDSNAEAEEQKHACWFGGLAHCESLTQLDLSNNTLDHPRAASLAEGLGGCGALRCLLLQDCKLNDAAMRMLRPALKACPGLTRLDLSRNAVSAKGIAVLGQKLVDVTLEGNDLGDLKADGPASESALSRLAGLTRLNLRSAKVGDEGGQAVRHILTSCSALTSLDLAFNSIGEKGLRSLSPALQHAAALSHLDLGGNELGDRGVAALAKHLHTCKALTAIDLKRNEIGDTGVRSLVVAVKSCKELSQLDLRQNQISSGGAVLLMEAMSGTRGRRLSVDVRDNAIAAGRKLATVCRKYVGRADVEWGWMLGAQLSMLRGDGAPDELGRALARKWRCFCPTSLGHDGSGGENSAAQHTRCIIMSTLAVHADAQWEFKQLLEYQGHRFDPPQRFAWGLHKVCLLFFSRLDSDCRRYADDLKDVEVVTFEIAKSGGIARESVFLEQLHSFGVPHTSADNALRAIVYVVLEEQQRTEAARRKTKHEELAQKREQDCMRTDGDAESDADAGGVCQPCQQTQRWRVR